MLYCSLDDASNSSLKNKLDQYDNINKPINYDRAPDFDNYNDININNNIQTNAHFPSFFNAQGDYENKNNGTTINQLKNINNDNINNNTNNQSLIDSLSFDDSNMSDDYRHPLRSDELSNKFKKKPLDHDYCINIITKELLNNGDASLMSSHDGLVYKHVKSCKICKSKIKSIMKDHYCTPEPLYNNKIEHFDNETNIIGYDIKELILIILGGIILIFIFDLLVKMGSKLN